MIRRSHILTTAALLAVCATPASAATYEDLHSADGAAASSGALTRDYGSPDAADAARETSPADRGQYTLNRDFGSPDAVDAAREVPPAEQYVLDRDFGSPDAVDAARDLPPASIATPVVEVRGTPSGGFDWGDAGIGAAGMLGLFSIAAGLALMLTGRKRRHAVSVATH